MVISHFLILTTMSATSSPGDARIQPLHNPSLAAQVVLPQRTGQNAGTGAKALLAKKLTKTA